MKKVVFIAGTVLLLTAAGCNPDTNTNPQSNHFKMTVNGTELSTLPENVIYMYIANADTMTGIFASGGTVIYNSVEIPTITTGTYPITGNQPAGTGGLRYQTVDSVYYIDDTHGTGSLTFDVLDISPGTIHEIKGSFSGTAATAHGSSVAITNGNFYYHQP